MHDIDRFIDSALTFLRWNSTSLRVSVIKYSFIGKQELGIIGKEMHPDGVDSTVIKGSTSIPIIPNECHPQTIQNVIFSSQGTCDVIDAI